MIKKIIIAGIILAASQALAIPQQPVNGGTGISNNNANTITATAAMHLPADINMQNAYNQSVAASSHNIQLTSAGYRISDNSDNPLFDIYELESEFFSRFIGHFSVQDTSGDEISFSGTTLFFNSETDAGVNGGQTQLYMEGLVPGGGSQIGHTLYGFDNETSGQISGFELHAILDHGNLNDIFYIKGYDGTYGARVGFGGSNINETISNFAIGKGYNDAIDPLALFEVDSTTLGSLPAPRMTTAQMNAIPVTPAETGMIIYVTDQVDGFYYFDGSNWVYLTNNSGAGNTRQAAYNAGNTVALATGRPWITANQGTPANSFYFSNGGPAAHTNDTVVGVQFTVSAPIFVTSLEYVDRYLASGQRQVGIYQVNNQALLVSDQVSKSDPLDSTTNYRVHAINPVQLVPGTQYLEVAIVPANEPYVYYSNALVPTPGISNTGNTFGQTSSTLVFPTTINATPNTVYGNGAFQFSTSSSSVVINDGTYNSLLTASSATQGATPNPLLTSTQETTLSGLLSSSDQGLFWFNSSNNLLSYYDGSTIQRLLTQASFLTGSTVAGHVAIFANTSGQLQDGGIPINTAASKFASDNTKTYVSSVSGATVSGNLLKAADILGTSQDSGIAASNIVQNNGSTYNINISGTAANSTNIGTTSTLLGTTYYPLFVSSSSTGNQAAFMNNTFSFSPMTGLNVLSVDVGETIATTSANTKLNVTGTDSSNSDSPAIGLQTNADAYPEVNLFPFTHGNSALSFDAYYNGSWKSAYSGSNFQIQSLGNQLSLNYSSGNAQGNAVTWSNGLILDTSGHINIPLLTASQVVVSDGSKNLASLAYTNVNTASTLVERDSSGNFSAGTIAAALTGNASTATTATNATNGSTVGVGTNASYYPLFVGSSTNSNQAFNLNTTLAFNPGTGRLGSSSLVFTGPSLLLTNSGNAQGIGLNGGNISLLTTPSANDTNHGLGYYGSSQSKSWNALTNVDGPVLFGYTGVVLGIANGTVSALHATKTNISLFDTGGSALSGTGTALTFNSILSAGNYINLGGGGRDIGVKSGGNTFITNNLDYNATTPGYQYTTTNVGAALEITNSGTLNFNTAPSGTAGSSATMTTQMAVSNTGVVNLANLTASGVVTTDGSKNLTSVSTSSIYTPTIGDGTNNFTTSTATGVYYHVGPLYFVQIRLVWTGKGSASAGSQAQISLPIAIGSSMTRASATMGYNSGIGFTGSFLGVNGSSGNAYLVMNGLSSTGTSTNVNVSQLSASGEVQIFITYWSN